MMTLFEDMGCLALRYDDSEYSSDGACPTHYCIVDKEQFFVELTQNSVRQNYI